MVVYYYPKHFKINFGLVLKILYFNQCALISTNLSTWFSNQYLTISQYLYISVRVDLADLPLNFTLLIGKPTKKYIPGMGNCPIAHDLNKHRMWMQILVWFLTTCPRSTSSMNLTHWEDPDALNMFRNVRLDLALPVILLKRCTYVSSIHWCAI